MYEAKHKGKIIRLTDGEYRSTRRRFNLKNFKVKDDAMMNKQGCSPCITHRGDYLCNGCPFMQFVEEGEPSYGCLALLFEILDTKHLEFDLTFVDIAYETEKGKASIEYIHQMLARHFKYIKH